MKIERKHIKISGLLLILISAVLLVRELTQYHQLPGMNDPVCEYVDLNKYKENTVTNGIIWTGLIILGVIMYLKYREIKQ